MTGRITRWRKSSRSHAANGCVEVGSTMGHVGVRDSKLGCTSPILTFTASTWSDFTAATRAGTFDR
ncbi:DUF397 domain-containing protein [Saccharopolyspora sp. NFXS83]|uniref:DUF397 domain-containing protein n=1 Tax=Saccharopolyspora sp. NFXS83 TaxID=2993560 RepID=UPI00224B8CB1|nr:DUF397 domain-containing protein [Saccharopolyspora sp. NFXS83]MCX2732986.1 DUF397 domain-containing protein [Saccharopolyspora sp. NFXS83]